MSSKVYIATILLEKNRWGSRIPSYRVSEWSSRFEKDGFDGMELWEEHATCCEPVELAKLQNLSKSIGVFNTYAEFSNNADKKRFQAAELIKKLGVKAVKYNLGADSQLCDTYVENLKEWAEMLPNDCRILSECHPGTVMEDPEETAGILKKLKDERFQLIAHTFGSPDMYVKWFKLFGSRITHAHIFLKNNRNEYSVLKREHERCSASFKALMKLGYKGDFTLEFTEGVRAPDETIARLYHCALEDLSVIKENISLYFNR